MINRSATGDRFRHELMHPRKDEIAALRSAILSSNGAITKQITWKAPSFCSAGEDRVTFRLQPRDVFQVIFHRGVKVKDSADLRSEDDTCLLRWVAPDRAILSLDDMESTTAQTAAIVGLANRWMWAVT